MNLWMKVIFFGLFATCLLALHACTVNPPVSTSTGTVLINDQATGSCPVKAWLDGTGPVIVTPGSIHTFSNVTAGSHSLTFSTTATTSCGGSSQTCYIYGNTGYSVSFNLLSNQTQTAGITDNGCNQLSVSNPVWTY